MQTRGVGVAHVQGSMKGGPFNQKRGNIVFRDPYLPIKKTAS